MATNGVRAAVIALFVAGTGVITPATADDLAAETERDQPREEDGSDSAQPGTPFRGSRGEWSQSVTTQTVGVGSEVQSRNPLYEMTFTLSPRYVLGGDGSRDLSRELLNAGNAAPGYFTEELAVRAELGVTREFTDSDTTTERGEWSLTDLVLQGEYTGSLVSVPGYRTRAGIRLPVLEVPTSKGSRYQGMLSRLGALVLIEQSVPLVRDQSAWFSGIEAGLALGYAHTFTQATEPTGLGFERIRMGPDGRALASDQLGGAAFARHQLSVVSQAGVRVVGPVFFGLELGLRPSWRYQFDADSEACIEIATGCATPRRVEDPQTYSVVTLFRASLALEVAQPLDVTLGYENLTLQLAPDGKRRNLLYSPDARFSLALRARLDELDVVF